MASTTGVPCFGNQTEVSVFHLLILVEDSLSRLYLRLSSVVIPLAFSVGFREILASNDDTCRCSLMITLFKKLNLLKKSEEVA